MTTPLRVLDRPSRGCQQHCFWRCFFRLGGANNTASGEYSSVSGDISYQEWVEEQGYLTTETDPVATASGYATESWVEEQGYLTTETDPVATASGYAIQTWVEEQGYSTVSGIEGLENYLSVDEENHTVLFSGANLQVVSGEGSTDAPVNGLGNIIVGYDENTSDDKSGSHNLVVGYGHTYSSYGGFVAGQDNSITGAFSSVSGVPIATLRDISLPSREVPITPLRDISLPSWGL